MENELPAIIALVTKLVDDAGILADALACHAQQTAGCADHYALHRLAIVTRELHQNVQATL